LKALNIPFKKVVLPGRVKCGGIEEEIVVAHGRLPSPAPLPCVSIQSIESRDIWRPTISAF